MNQLCRLVALAAALLAAPAIAAADCPDGFEIEAVPLVETAPKSKKVEVARCNEGGLCLSIRF